MPPNQHPSREQGHNCHETLVGIDAAQHRGVQAQEVEQEAPDRVDHQVGQENVAGLQSLAEAA